jgi:hypothetical protein
MYRLVIMVASNDFPLNVELKPLGYDKNPFTGRLNKKCKRGFERHIDTRTKKMKCYKKCKPNEIRNEETKRCRAKSPLQAKTRRKTPSITQKKHKKRKTLSVSKTPSFDFDDVYSNISDFKESFPTDVPKVMEKTPSFEMNDVYSKNSDIQGSNPKNKSSKSKSKSPIAFDKIYNSISDFTGSNPKNKSVKKSSSPSKSPMFGLDDVYKINSDFNDSNPDSHKVIVGFRKQKNRKIRFK